MYVCTFLSNFHPAFMPPPQQLSETDVEEYLNGLSDLDDESESKSKSESNNNSE